MRYQFSTFVTSLGNGRMRGIFQRVLRNILLALDSNGMDCTDLEESEAVNAIDESKLSDGRNQLKMTNLIP